MRDDELEAFAREHLSYEVWMLGETTRWLVVASPGAPLAARNVYLESFGIHARVLTAFLANSGSHADDVLASHYSGDWRGEDPAPELARTVNKQVAHLTTARLQKVPLGPGEIYERLVDSFRRFIDALPEHRQPWFDWFR